MNKKLLGTLSKFVVTKGLESKESVLVNIDNPLYFATNEPIKASISKTTDKQSVFDTINNDMLYRLGEEDMETMEANGAVVFEEFNNATYDVVDFDIDRAVLDTRVSKDILELAKMFGEFVVSPTGVKSNPFRYFYQNKNGNTIPMLYFPNVKNNIGVIRQENGSDLYFLDGFVSNNEGALEKDLYTNEVILRAYLNVMNSGSFMAEGFDKPLSGSLKQIFNFFVYKVKLGYSVAKISYVSMIGGRKRDFWKLRADVLTNVKGQICWLKETEKFESVLARTEFVASCPLVARTSMTQGEKFMIMGTPAEARKWESQFVEGKYDISATILPTMKADKPIEKYNLVFGTIVNNKDNNSYGNALWQNDYAGKTYCVVNDIPVRIKYSTQKSTSDIQIVDNNGASVDKWIIAPISEVDPSSDFVDEDKIGNFYQLIHMGLTPERVVITVEGQSYEAIMFRDIPQYIDYLTSSDYNVDKDFDIKPYSTMMSCVANHIATNHGVNALDTFIHRLTGIIDYRKLNQIVNLAGKTTARVKLFNVK